MFAPSEMTNGAATTPPAGVLTMLRMAFREASSARKCPMPKLQALHGIRLSATVFSATPFGLGLVCLALYPITKELNLRIGDELAERRKKFATE